MLSNEQSMTVKGTWRNSETKKLRDNIIDFSREEQVLIRRLMRIMKLIRTLMLNPNVNRNKTNSDTKHIKITKDSKREISIQGRDNLFFIFRNQTISFSLSKKEHGTWGSLGEYERCTWTMGHIVRIVNAKIRFAYYFCCCFCRGIMLLLMLRWFIQSTTEQKNTNYSPDDDFEGGVRRGRIKLRPEDVKGMSLT